MTTNNIENEIILSEILLICLERGSHKSCCPSEIARKLYPNIWREKMELIRQLAQTLEQEGLIKITQKGIPVNANQKGPIRLTWIL